MTNNSTTKELSAKIRERLAYLAKYRKKWLDECKEVSKHIAPERGRFPSDTPETRADRSSQYNSRPDKYLHNLASILQSGLTSPARPWFKLSLSNVDANEWGDARDWLTQVENVFERTFRMSNFYPSIHAAYIELAAFGTVAVGVSEDTRPGRLGIPQFTTYTAGECLISQNDSGQIDTVYRILYMSAEEVASYWKDTCSKRVRELSASSPFEPIKLIHAVEPRKRYDTSKIDKFNMPFGSVWLEDGAADSDTGGVLAIGGFLQLPYNVARWDAVSDSPYGVGPGQKAVKDARSLNLLDQIATYGLNKAVNPPILAPAHMNVQLNNAPGGITYFAGSSAENQIKPLYTIGADLNAALIFMNRWEDILKETFQNDLFIFLMNRSNVTATEISERNEEKLLLLGPVLERIQTELLNPMFERVYHILEKNKLIPPAPPELLGLDLRPEFTGLLAQAQKVIATEGVKNVAAFAAQLASIDSRVLDKIDMDQTIDIYSTMLGIPNGIIRSDEETKKIRDEDIRRRETQNAKANESAELSTVLGYAKDLASIDTKKNSALTELIGKS